MGFESLQISEPLKKALSSSVNSGRFPHAAILEDEDSERLMDTAKTLAAALVCSGDDKPCGRCINCLKARSDSHPDIKIFEPDPKTNNFKVETVREIRSDAYIVANEADRKVYILKDAQNMLVPAQNALLKVLEEPPEGVCFLLLTDDKNVFLQTVLSRCAVFSQGGGRRVDSGVFEAARAVAAAVPEANEYPLLAATAVFERINAVQSSLAGSARIFRAAVLIKSGVEAPEEYKTEAQKLAGNVTTANLMRMITCADDLAASFERNENYTLLITRMCAELRRASGR